MHEAPCLLTLPVSGPALETTHGMKDDTLACSRGRCATAREPLESWMPRALALRVQPSPLLCQHVHVCSCEEQNAVFWLTRLHGTMRTCLRSNFPMLTTVRPSLMQLSTVWRLCRISAFTALPRRLPSKLSQTLCQARQTVVRTGPSQGQAGRDCPACAPASRAALRFLPAGRLLYVNLFLLCCWTLL